MERREVEGSTTGSGHGSRHTKNLGYAMIGPLANVAPMHGHRRGSACTGPDRVRLALVSSALARSSSSSG